MRRTLWLTFGVIAFVSISVMLSVVITTHYIRQQIVVVDLGQLAAYQQRVTKDMDKDAAIKEVGDYYDRTTKHIKARKELVLVKQAVVNNEQFKDITSEYTQ